METRAFLFRVVAWAGLVPALAVGVPAHADPAEVVLQNNQFVPRQVTVGAGETVVWTHRDGSLPHTVTADDRSFDSHPACSAATGVGCMRQGDTYRHVFGRPGKFPYYCKVHGGPGGQGMSGVVIVRG